MAEPLTHLSTNIILWRVVGRLEFPPESFTYSNTQNLIILMDKQSDTSRFFWRDAFEFKIYLFYHLPGQTNYVPYNFFSDAIIIIVKIYVTLNLFEIVFKFSLTLLKLLYTHSKYHFSLSTKIIFVCISLVLLLKIFLHSSAFTIRPTFLSSYLPLILCIFHQFHVNVFWLSYNTDTNTCKCICAYVNTILFSLTKIKDTRNLTC
jgi:hypothetical protein